MIQGKIKIICLLLFGFNFSLAQGLNNNYALDQTDLTNLFSLQGLDVYKFPLNNKKPIQYVNCIIYQYEKGILTDSINLFKNLEKSYKNYGKEILPHTQSTRTFCRFYFRKNKETLDLIIDLDGFQQTISFDFKDIVLYGSRAFDISINPLNQRKRIMAYYGTMNEVAELHCAGNAKNADLISKYDNLILIYIEPIWF